MGWAIKILMHAGQIFALCILVSFSAHLCAEETRYAFDLGVQPLAKALADYSRIIGQPVLFNPQQVRALQAPRLQGELTAAQAIQILLAGSKLQAEPAHQGWLIKPVPQKNLTATAQNTRESFPSSVVGTEETLVIGRYSDSLRSALEQKANANQWMDVILAQDLGKFPALNIAEALQRSPGVSVVRDRGEALFVSIRGLPPSFNSVTLNGRSLATNENVRNSEQYGRRFHYDTFPVELVSGVEVHKTVSAADDEGAIGGSVNIHTFKPLALGHTQLSTTAAVSHPQLADELDPRWSALGVWVNPEKTLGFLVATAYAERSLRQDRALNFRWSELPEGIDIQHDSDSQESTNAYSEPIISPGSVRPTLELEDRKRLGVSAALQWQPDHHLAVDVNLIDLQQRINYDEFSYSADYELDQLLTGQNEIRNGALIGGATTTGAAQISRESAGLVDRNRAQDVSVNWLHNAWQFRVEAAHSQADSYNDNPILRTRLRRTGDVALRFWYPKISGDQVPQIDYQNISLIDPAAFPGRRLEWRTNRARDSEASLALKAQVFFERSVITSVEGGVQWRQRERQYSRRDAIINEGIAGEFFPVNYFQEFPVRHFLGETQGGLPSEWLIPNEQAFWRDVDLAALESAVPSASDLRNSYHIDEQVTALFVQMNLAGNVWRGNLGVRDARTQQTSQGYWLEEAPGADTALPVSFLHDYQHLLPAANLVVDLHSSLLWRSAIARVINRPDLQDLAPRLTLNSGDELTAVGGNPGLQPVVAWQYDSALEWYFSPNSLFGIGAFYKELDKFIQTDISVLLFNEQDYELTAKTNGASAQVKGVEVNYQQVFYHLPAPLRQMGIHGNYTYTESSAEYRTGERAFTDALADVARNSINVGIFFEFTRADLRLSYSWRDAVLSEVGSNNLAAQNSAAFGSLDMQTAVHLNEDTSLVLEAINLTNAVQEEYVAAREFASYTHYGRTLIAGIKLRF